MAENKKSKFVYIMRCASFYKIGISLNPESRRSTLQTSNPLDVDLIATFKTERFLEIEKELHEKFKLKKTRGEWFELDEDDLNFLRIDYGFSFKLKIRKLNQDNNHKGSKSEIKLKRINNLELQNCIDYFEDVFDVEVAVSNKIKKSYMAYGHEITIDSISDLFNQNYDPNKALSKIISFSKIKYERINDPRSYFMRKIKYLFINHFDYYDIDVECTDILSSVYDLVSKKEGIDEFIKNLHFEKYKYDLTEFWDQFFLSKI